MYAHQQSIRDLTSNEQPIKREVKSAARTVYKTQREVCSPLADLAPLWKYCPVTGSDVCGRKSRRHNRAIASHLLCGRTTHHFQQQQNKEEEEKTSTGA
jgi:hypothetical protein